MNTENVACEIVNGTLHDLYDRSGFDAWWYSIDDETREEIENELVELVKSILDKNA